MVDRIWLRSYPAGMPAEIDADRFRSIPDMLDFAFERFADRPAFHNLGRSLSYAALDRLSRHFAAFLQGLPGMAKGERVAIMAPNLLQYPVVLFGILRAGLTVVNVNPLYTPRELEHQLKDSGAKAIVILENFAHTLQSVIDRTPVEHVVTTEVGDLLPVPKRWLVNLVIKRVKKMVPAWRIDGAVPLRAALARGAAGSFAPVTLAADDIAFLQYTGGTTGVSKGAMLTHRNILANMEQTGAWISADFKEGDRNRHRAAAALPHLLPDRDAVVHQVGQPQRARHQPARPAGAGEGAGAVEVEHHDRRQHAVQRPSQHARLRPARLFRDQGGDRRRRGGAEAGGRALAAGDRPLPSPRATG